MTIKRLLRHLSMPRWQVRRLFPKRTVESVEAAIRETETAHGGQICFAVEGALDLLPLLRGVSARERALEVFADLRVWDTERNNGVLIYLLLADHDVEILADRDINRFVAPQTWEGICHTMEAAFRAGRFEDGVIAGIEAVAVHLKRHYPRSGNGPNEVPDRPTVL